MAAGATPPLLFFERRRRRAYLQSAFLRSAFCSGDGNLKDVRNSQQRRSCNEARAAHLRLRANGHPAKDI
jgi:hypothetical protein